MKGGNRRGFRLENVNYELLKIKIDCELTNSETKMQTEVLFIGRDCGPDPCSIRYTSMDLHALRALSVLSSSIWAFKYAKTLFVIFVVMRNIRTWPSLSSYAKQ